VVSTYHGSHLDSRLTAALFLGPPAARRTASGEYGLTTAMHPIGFVLLERHREYAVLGRTRTAAAARAARLTTGA